MSAPLTHLEYRATRYFPGLNGIRCCAITAVIHHHCYYGPVLALRRGFLGVDLFFVLSGFLIVTLLRRERDATGTISLAKFWLRRCLRLMPALYLLLAVLAAFYATRIGTPSADRFFGSLPANALYLSNWVRTDATHLSILWSLATEEQFYIVWPLVELFAHMLAWPILVLLILLNQCVNFGLLDPALGRMLSGSPRDYEIVAATYTPICLGVALARIAHHERGFLWLRALLGRRGAAWLAAGAIAVLIVAAPSDIAGWPRLALQLLMTALVGAIVLQPRSTMARLLETRPIARIGTISYGMYLYHLWVMLLAAVALDRLGLGSAVALFVPTLLLTAAVAEMSYRFFERPIIDFSHRWRGRSPVNGGSAHGQQ